MAIMMSRLYSGNYDMICLRNAYHGLSGGYECPPRLPRMGHPAQPRADWPLLTLARPACVR